MSDHGCTNCNILETNLLITFCSLICCAMVFCFFLSHLDYPHPLAIWHLSLLLKHCLQLNFKTQFCRRMSTSPQQPEANPFPVISLASYFLCWLFLLLVTSLAGYFSCQTCLVGYAFFCLFHFQVPYEQHIIFCYYNTQKQDQCLLLWPVYLAALQAQNPLKT